MQAVHIPEHGSPDVLRIVDLPVPKPGRGQVLVRVLAVSVNHLDLWVRRCMPGMPIPLPRIPGCDGTGEIAALGEGCAGTLQVGQRVVVALCYVVALAGPTAADNHPVGSLGEGSEYE